MLPLRFSRLSYSSVRFFEDVVVVVASAFDELPLALIFGFASGLTFCRVFSVILRYLYQFNYD